MVIRPHIEFLKKVASKHFPSLWLQEKEQVKNMEEEDGVDPNVAALSSLDSRIRQVRDAANKAEEEEDEDTEDQARVLLKSLKKERKSLVVMISTQLQASPSIVDDGAASPHVLAMSHVIEKLIDHCNRENKKTKKEIFRVIRCHNCSQASTGGTKIGVKLALPPHQVEWMTKVRMACSHSSVDKTMRILLEWYIAVISHDCMMEYELLTNTEAVRPDMGGFGMCLSEKHENNLHMRGRRPKAEADQVLRETYERNTPLQKGFGNEEARKFHQETYGATAELAEILWKLGRGC
jgi:hypothetical protein